MNKIRFNENRLLLLLAIVILSLPIVLTKIPITIFDFSNTGQVGDTIGGITAPFVGLISAYLIYKAFKVQIDANKIQSKNNEFGIALKLIDDLDSKLNNQNNRYEYTLPNGEISKIDKANFYEIVRFWNGMDAYRKYYANMIIMVIRQVKYFKKYIDRSKNLSNDDKLLLLEKASLTFGSKLVDPFKMLIQTEKDSEEDKQFYAYCRKFYDTTLQDFLFHLIDIDDLNETT